MNRKIAAFATALALAAGTSAGAVTMEAGGLQIAEPGSVVNGRSIGNMAAEWWRFLLESPMSAHPNYGNPYVPGPLAGEGTYFLYGLPEGESGTLEATVKAGSAMLLPLRPWANLKTEPDETAQDLFDQLEPLVASIRNLSVTVNGEDVAGANGVDLIADFRERFPSEPGDVAFGVTFPEEDASFGLDGFVTDLIVADGHWMLFDDLRVGGYEIVTSFDVLGDDGGPAYSAAVTQMITVAPVPVPAALPLLLAGLAGLAGVASRRRRG